MKNVNLFQVIFHAANAASGFDSCLDAGLSVDNFVCVDNSVDNNSVDNGFDNSVDYSVDDCFDDTVDNGFDRAAKFRLVCVDLL